MMYIPDQTGDDVGQQLLISELRWSPHMRPPGDLSRRSLLIHIFVQVLRKTFSRTRHSRVLREMVGVCAVEIRQPERPGATLGNSHALHVKAWERSGGERRVLEQVSVVNSRDRCDRLICGVSHGRQFSLASDPDVAETVGHWRVDQRNVWFD